MERNRERIGTVEQVLVTDISPEDRKCLGRSMREAPETDGEILVSLNGLDPETGLFIPVRITEAYSYDLIGEAL